MNRKKDNHEDHEGYKELDGHKRFFFVLFVS
jgi:hypothetical protein